MSLRDNSDDKTKHPKVVTPYEQQQTSHKQLSSSQTQDATVDHEKLHHLHPLDARLPSVVSLQNEGCTVLTTKQCKSAEDV